MIAMHCLWIQQQSAVNTRCSRVMAEERERYLSLLLVGFLEAVGDQMLDYVESFVLVLQEFSDVLMNSYMLITVQCSLVEISKGYFGWKFYLSNKPFCT